MAVAEELAGSDELEALYELDASEAEPEPEDDDKDFGDEGEDEEDDEGGKGIQPEEMPHG
jgi:hypothetical protein